MSSRLLRAPTRRRVTKVVCSVAIAMVTIGSSAFAASPAPSAGGTPVPSADPATESNLEAWLDVPFSGNTTVGKPVHLGLTLWDNARQTLAELNELTIHLSPAKGSAKPTSAKATIDWPGHLVVDIVVPKGGPGELSIGLPAEVCATDGSCTEQELLVPFRGVGPPPDAPRSALVVARVERIAGPLLAGQPFDVRVTLEPQARWDEDALDLPDQLVAFVNASGGPDLASTLLNQAGGGGGSSGIEYLGQLTVDEPGDVTLQIAIPGNGSEDQVFGRAATRLQIGGTATPSDAPSARPGSNGPTPSAPADGDPPWVLIGAVVLGLAALGYAIRRGFADL